MPILDHFIFNSDYSADKIAFAQTGTYSSPSTASGYPYYAFINTHIGTLLRAEGDFTVENESGRFSMIRRRPDGAFVKARTFMHNNECWIALLFYYMDSEYLGHDIYYRIWAYYSDSEAKNIDIPPTANATGRKLIFTTDDKYPQYISDGYANIGDTAYHNLGRIPYIKAWTLFTQQTMPNPNGGGDITVDYYTQEQNAYFGVNGEDLVDMVGVIDVTDTQIITHSSPLPTGAAGVYYRIYQI